MKIISAMCNKYTWISIIIHVSILAKMFVDSAFIINIMNDIKADYFKSNKS